MIINLLATWIPALGIAFLGVLKLLGNSRVVEEMSNVGVGRYLRLLGVMEIAFAALFVVPATMKLGFILASCYFAGAIATELSHNVLKVNPFPSTFIRRHVALSRDTVGFLGGMASPRHHAVGPEEFGIEPKGRAAVFAQRTCP